MSYETIRLVSSALGLPKEYFITAPQPDVVQCFLNAQWIRSIARVGTFFHPSEHDFLTPAEIQSALYLQENVGQHWQKVLIQVLAKEKEPAYALARSSGHSSGLVTDVSYSQHLHYVATSNSKNLWKDAYKKYNEHAVPLQLRESGPIGMEDQAAVLREAVHRMFGCSVIPYRGKKQSTWGLSYVGSKHPNIISSYFALETDTHFFVLLENIPHTVRHCVSFSPAILGGNEARPLFILYQLIEAVRDIHDRGLHLGDITLDHLLLDANLHLTLLPLLKQSVLHCDSIIHYPECSQDESIGIGHNHIKDPHCRGENVDAVGYMERFHSFASLIKSQDALSLLAKSNIPCSTNCQGECNFQTALPSLVQLWAQHQITNLDYLLCLNYLANRTFGSPQHHPIVPWVTDFSSPTGGWRDLTKTKFRLNKGDQQLEQTYQIASSQEGGNQVAHHVTEMFSEITYYVYKARVTSKPLLTRYVRQQWVPEQYPSTMSRLYQWTPDECIPEFYTDASIFRSLHGDLCDLEVPNWCSSAEDFLQWHLGALESTYVSQKLHHWIDLNFGHKLSGAAAVKAKNVCLQLVDGHTTLSSGGVVQVFTIPHPPRQTPSPYLGRSPPKITYQGFQSSKPEKTDDSVEVECSSDYQEEDRESVSSLSMSHKLSRSRTSLAEEKPQQVPSISLPQDYNPLLALNQLEMLFNFVLKISKEIPQEFSKNKESQLAVKQAAHLRRVRDMQALGCIMVEIFAPAKCRILGPLASLEQRYKLVKNVLTNDINDIPRCVRHTLSIIFQTNKLQSTTESDLPTRYDPVTSGGLPPPSPHQFLQRLINVIVFPKYFQNLYAFVSRNREYSKLFQESQVVEPETEKKKFMLKVVEIQVHLAAKALPQLLPSLTTEGMEILLPYLSELFKNRETCVTAAYYLTGPLAQALGPAKTKQYLLPSLVRLYEADVVTSKHLKLFHRSFLLQLIVRLELQTFLMNFITPLIEGVGGYKEVLDTSQTATEIVRKQSTTLKSVDISLSEGITSPCEEDSHSSTVELTLQQDLPAEIREAAGEATDVEAEPEVFVFDEGGDGEGGDGEGSPDTLHDPQQLRSPVVSDTVSLDETSLQDTQGSISPICPSPHSPTPSVDGPASDPDTPTATTPGTTSCINIPKLSSVNLKTPLHSTSLPNFGHDKDFETEMSLANNLELNHGETDGKGWYKEKNKVASMSEICCESVLWLSHRLGPVLTSRYLTRNLLRMLTLCYLPEAGALTPIPPDSDDELSVSRKRIAGDRAAAKVLHCLSEIACLYGEQVILVQYLCHVCELVASCRRRLSGSLEGGLLGAMALLQHLLTYLTDATFMEHLQEMLIRNAVYPVIRLLSSTKVTFPHGGAARGILAYRIVDCIFIMALRVGREMSKTILTPTITRFLTAFDKVHTLSTGNQLGTSPRSFETDEGHVEDCESPACTFGPAEENQSSEADSVKAKALEEMKQVFCPELAYVSYVPLCRFLGASYMESSLPNHDLLHSLCLHYDENNQAHHAAVLTDDGLAGSSIVPEEGSPRRLTAPGTNVALTGNRIDIKDISEGSSSEADQSAPSIGFALAVDITKYTNKMTNPLRHLRGNWLAYWEHEIGRSEQDCRFNFKQIKLQTFSGHTSSVKSLHVLDNENSFISCSKDKTVKLWSLRSQGDGSVHSSAQWTYTGHKKSVLSVSFCDSIRLAASCDSTIHIWDPFIGASVKQLDSLKYSPVTVLTALSAPSSQLLASTTDATLKVLDLRTCSYTHEFKVSVGGAGLVRCISTDDEGRLVAVAHSTGIISVLDIRTGHLLSTWKPHEGEVLSVQWHKGGTFLSSALDQTVSVWSVDDTKLKFTLRGPTEPVHLISLYGDEVITGTTANRIGVHTTISPTASFSSTRLRSDTFRGVLTTMALLPLNRLLLLGADNGTIRLLC